MNVNKLLLAYDGSKESENALKIAEYLARLYKSEIVGFFANYISYPITPNYIYFSGYIEEAAEKNKKEIERKFKKIKRDLASKKLKFSSKIVRGEVAKNIDKISKEIKADIVLIGNTGKGLFERILIGSNTLKVLHSSKIPVLTVPGTVTGDKYKLNKVLVPVDISKNNLTSLDYAIDLALKTNSSITVLYVLSITNNIMEFPSKVIEQIITGIDNSLEAIVYKAKEKAEIFNSKARKIDNSSKLKALRIRKKYLVDLRPAVRISKYAKKNNFDLIVMNSHEKGSMERFFLGSVTEEVIRNSGCPVISIKP